MRNLSLNEKIYVESYVENNKKSMLLAYLLWFFLGMLGIHRFYLGRWISGLILLLLTALTSWWTAGIPTIIWLFIDMFLIIPMVNSTKRKAYREAIREINRSKR
ncbi:TM2 domain-containing protein [Phocicoccus pinnipedialis]|uniref:TM2 domain-containing protein n=1 Tax=Phocicoccus pinnipedialis TaxID=110845 RepID=A0A6V7R545_9BACL|nr:TM2 domain-containing protein [Jeotgalicoccus pinnipedialis]MBP1940050.1 TM2 domain-containing membrane protein YozV [Jeotgalicoccus pinnipedialis]CAD2072002.1 hypothetical protein JEOPIN946_00200 [Jeotgalicoccus pinnipedialis]